MSVSTPILTTPSEMASCPNTGLAIMPVASMNPAPSAPIFFIAVSSRVPCRRQLIVPSAWGPRLLVLVMPADAGHLTQFTYEKLEWPRRLVSELFLFLISREAADLAKFFFSFFAAAGARSPLSLLQRPRAWGWQKEKTRRSDSLRVFVCFAFLVGFS